MPAVCRHRRRWSFVKSGEWPALRRKKVALVTGHVPGCSANAWTALTFCSVCALKEHARTSATSLLSSVLSFHSGELCMNSGTYLLQNKLQNAHGTSERATLPTFFVFRPSLFVLPLIPSSFRCSLAHCSLQRIESTPIELKTTDCKSMLHLWDEVFPEKNK